MLGEVGESGKGSEQAHTRGWEGKSFTDFSMHGGVVLGTSRDSRALLRSVWVAGWYCHRKTVNLGACAGV